MNHHALAAQLYCLRERASAARERCAESEPSACVSDFLFDKDAVCPADAGCRQAGLVLNPCAGALARRIAPLIWWCICKRHRNAGRRIAARGELAFPDGYLKRIDAAYSEFFMQYEAAPVVMVNTERLDFVDKPEDFELLLRCISEAKGQRSYFNVAV